MEKVVIESCIVMAKVALFLVYFSGLYPIGPRYHLESPISHR